MTISNYLLCQMAFKRKFSRPKSYKKSRRGKYSRTAAPRQFAAKVKQVLMKKTETKYLDRGVENQQLYHNTGFGVGIPPFPISSIPGLFDSWANITMGTSRSERIGDRITPRGMSLKIYLANKADRPNTMVRLIVAVLPKSRGTTVTGSQFSPFQIPNTGILGNVMLYPPDQDKGVQFLYDKIHRIGPNQAIGRNYPEYGSTAREGTKVVKLWIKRKRSSDIIYDTVTQEIVNKPIAVYAIPYEQYSTLTTDNIASFACYQRLYYKDL